MAKTEKKAKTMLDELRRIDPDSIGERFPGGVRLYPEDIGFERVEICEYFRQNKKNDRESCLKCWSRPIPEK